MKLSELNSIEVGDILKNLKEENTYVLVIEMDDTIVYGVWYGLKDPDFQVKTFKYSDILDHYELPEETDELFESLKYFQDIKVAMQMRVGKDPRRRL